MRIRYLWILTLSLSLVLFIMQTSASNINPNGITIFNYDGSLMSQFDNGDYTLDQNRTDLTPDDQGSVSPTTGNFITDTFSSIKNWFKESVGGSFILGLYYGVPNLLSGIGLPQEISFALGFFWSVMGIFSFILFLRGGE